MLPTRDGNHFDFDNTYRYQGTTDNGLEFIHIANFEVTSS